MDQEVKNQYPHTSASLVTAVLPDVLFLCQIVDFVIWLASKICVWQMADNSDQLFRFAFVNSFVNDGCCGFTFESFHKVV